MDKEGRLDWIDVAKGIGILLVLCAHILDKENFLWNVINQFHMPLFYMLSGYLYSRKKWKKFTCSKIVSLWLPYVATGMIMEVIALLLNEESFLSFIKTSIGIIFLLKRGWLLGATWFVIVLFFGLFLFDLINRLISNIFIRGGCCVILFFVGCFIHFPLYISHIMVCQLFLYFGFVLHEYHLIEKYGIHNKLLVVTGIITLSIVVLCSLINRTGVSTNTYTHPIIFLIAALLGSISTISFSSIITQKVNNGIVSGIKYLGKRSAGLMIWQFVAFKCVITLQIIILGLSWSRISDYPVLYDYNGDIWFIAYMLAGIAISLGLQRIADLIISPGKKAIVKLFDSNKIDSRELHSSCPQDSQAN